MKRERLTITLRRDYLKQIDNLIDRKHVRNRSHAIEQILSDKFGETFLRSAVVLGGGSGIKVNGKLTSPLLAEIDGIPLVKRHIEMLKSIGVEEVVFGVGKFGDDVRELIGDGSFYDMKFVFFERDFGSASVLRQAKNLLKDTFVMFNGHIIVEGVDLEDMVVFHKNLKGACTIGMSTVEHPQYYGQLIMRGNHVCAFNEKPQKNVQLSHLINAGIYVMEPEICDMVRPEKESLEQNIFPALAKQHSLYGYHIDAPWSRINIAASNIKNKL